MDNEEQDNDHDTSRNLLDSFNSDGKLNFVTFIRENELDEFYINDKDLKLNVTIVTKKIICQNVQTLDLI